MDFNKDKKILYNKGIASNYFRLGISWETPLITAGQFVMLRVTGSMDPLLRRPFCIYRVIGGAKKGGKTAGTGIEVMYRVVGRGTELLSRMRPGEPLDLIGPLGNGFSYPLSDKRPVLVAGGIGIASFYMLAERLKNGVLLFGARGAEDAAIARDFKDKKKISLDVRITTEDGSIGEKGLVTGLLKKELKRDCLVYACGPARMLKSVAEIAVQESVPCFVSLEGSMACGIGVCLGCAVKTRPCMEGENREKANRLYRMVCSDGPVFSAYDIDWSAF